MGGARGMGPGPLPLGSLAAPIQPSDSPTERASLSEPTIDPPVSSGAVSNEDFRFGPYFLGPTQLGTGFRHRTACPPNTTVRTVIFEAFFCFAGHGRGMGMGWECAQRLPGCLNASVARVAGCPRAGLRATQTSADPVRDRHSEGANTHTYTRAPCQFMVLTGGTRGPTLHS